MPIDYKSIARLKMKEVSNRKIADSLSISRNTVNRCIKTMEASNLSYAEILVMNDAELKKLFNKAPGSKKQETYVVPDFEHLTKELAKPGVTMQLLWEEYTDDCRLQKKTGYQLTQFKKYFNEYLSIHEFTSVIHHKAGERIEVDWAGTKLHWTDPDTGEAEYGFLFVSVLSFSGYAFALACPDMKTDNWINAHNKMYAYFGGVTQILVPDNLKTGVIKHTKEEVVLNKTYSDMADYYGTTIIPARVKKPKDKALVENTVGKLTTYIIAKMRDYQFFSIDEYNERLMVELDKFNHKKFQKKEGSRASMFEMLEKEALSPLPDKPYELCTWKKAKVQSNSHISFQKCYYSVPYEYIGKEVDLKIFSDRFEVYSQSTLICTHRILMNRIGAYDTNLSHMPPNSASYGEWNSTRFLNWAKAKGPYTYQVIHLLFKDSKAEQRHYNAAHAILKLADSYSSERLENSCRLALSLSSRPGYKNIKNILIRGEDQCQQKKTNEKDRENAFLRGGDYFDKR